MRKIFFLTLTVLLSASLAYSEDIKDADLSGSWYPADPAALTSQIKDYLKKAHSPEINGDTIAIISPHAGINFSGPIAAYGFKLAQKKKVDTVIVVGFSHKTDYDGIAVFDKDGIKTPLGILYTDKELSKALAGANKKIFLQSDPFKEENSVELILPFIQASLGSPKVVLLAMGGSQGLNNSQLLGEALAEVLKEQNNFLIVASTDMSHYLSDEQARGTDASTAELIKAMEPEKLFSACSGHNRLCGTGALTSVMIAAKKLGANKAYILNRANSGDTTGDKNRVVGYVSAALVKESDSLLNSRQKDRLLKIAREAITQYVTAKIIPNVTEDGPALTQEMGAFVTLRENGRLRGCIGNLIGTRPLYLTVRDMAIAAASADVRFSALRKEELGKIKIEVSVLSPLRKIASPDEIILGKHGVLVRNEFTSGVYLPQVATETGWSKEEFLNSLCAEKAGLPADAWKTGSCEIYIFTAEIFEE